MKQRSTAIILCLFLGGIGVHRFYLGKNGTGFLYLIFCWTFIPAFCAFVDLIGLCFFETDETFNKDYNSAPQSVSSESAAKDLLALAELFQKDLLTRDEYDSKKTELLKRIG